MWKQSFKIDDNIYPQDYITQALNDFEEVAQISFEKWVVTIESLDGNEEEIFREFMNYIIWLINE